MSNFIAISPFVTTVLGVFLNFFWIYNKDSLSMGLQVIFLALTIFLIVFTSFLVAVNMKGKNKLKALHIGKWVLFIYYLYILVMLLFVGGLFQIYRTYQGEFQIVPFHTIDTYVSHYKLTGSFVSFYNLLGNILVMMPLGYFIPTLFSKTRKFWVFVPIAGIFALSVELIQWKTATGIGDIDDSILNFTGAVIAYFFTRLSQIIREMLKA